MKHGDAPKRRAMQAAFAPARGMLIHGLRPKVAASFQKGTALAVKLLGLAISAWNQGNARTPVFDVLLLLALPFSLTLHALVELPPAAERNHQLYRYASCNR